MEKQAGDIPTPVFSFTGKVEDHPQQVCCYITHTNEKTHDYIRASLAESPIYTGIIQGAGPRYCPSIEDKVKNKAMNIYQYGSKSLEICDACSNYINGKSKSVEVTSPNQYKKHFIIYFDASTVCNSFYSCLRHLISHLFRI